MAKLFLLRHLKSQWNQDNRFAGWTDGPLTKGVEEDVRNLAQRIFQNKIDIIYTSPLFRNMDTAAKILECLPAKYPLFIHLDGGKTQKWANFTDISNNDIPTYVSENLNERYYGKLQGLNKEETIKKYGEERVHLWRRSYDIAPPGGESERDVYKRTVPFYRKYVEKDLKQGKNVLIVASHNSLRSIVKYLEKISNDDIINLEIPYAGLMEYNFTKGGKYIKIK